MVGLTMNQSKNSSIFATRHTSSWPVLYNAALLSILTVAAIATGWLMCHATLQGRLQLRHSSRMSLSLPVSAGSGVLDVQSEFVKERSAPYHADWTFPGASNCLGELRNLALCEWCNATFVQQYPLSTEMLERSYFPGSPCSMPSNLLGKLRSGEPVKLAVIGGSMTMGTHCFDSSRPLNVPSWSYRSETCPWMYKMQRRLQQLFPAANISIANHARGAFAYGEHMAMGTLKAATDADVLFIDMQVNSQIYKEVPTQQGMVDKFIWQALQYAHEEGRQLGILFVESFSTCAQDRLRCDSACPPHLQGIFKFNFTGQETNVSFCNSHWFSTNVERPVAQHYKLPIASYRDAVWPGLHDPHPLFPCFWNARGHPDELAHYMFADVVTHGFLRAIDQAHHHHHSSAAPQAAASEHSEQVAAALGTTARCPQHQALSMFHQRQRQQGFCDASKVGSNGTFLSNDKPETFVPVSSMGCWNFTAESPERAPGWMCTWPATQSGIDTLPHPLHNVTPPGPLVPSAEYSGYGVIAFRTLLSDKPQLQLTYLVSYQGMGAIDVFIYSDPVFNATQDVQDVQPLATYRLDATIEARFSIPQTTVLVGQSQWSEWQQDKDALQLPATMGSGSYLVVLRTSVRCALKSRRPVNFKLLAVASC